MPDGDGIVSTWGGRKGRTRLLVKDSLSRLRGELDAGSSSSNRQVPRGNTDSQRRILMVFPQPRGPPPAPRKLALSC